MSSEPLATEVTVPDAAASERGLLIAMLVLVLFGTAAILLMN